MINQTVVVNNLIRAREACGLSQTELAKRCKLAANDINNIERRKMTISPDVLIQIADALNCNPCDLLLFISSEHQLDN